MTAPRAAAFRRIWGAPLILTLLTLASLVGALIVEGVWDRIATAVLFCVLAFAIGKGWRGNATTSRRSRKTHRDTRGESSQNS